MLLSHSYTPGGSIYFSYIRDVLFLSLHYTHGPGHPKALQDSYDGQLDEFATVLVHDIMWEKLQSTEYRTNGPCSLQNA